MAYSKKPHKGLFEDVWVIGGRGGYVAASKSYSAGSGDRDRGFGPFSEISPCFTPRCWSYFQGFTLVPIQKPWVLHFYSNLDGMYDRIMRGMISGIESVTVCTTMEGHRARIFSCLKVLVVVCYLFLSYEPAAKSLPKVGGCVMCCI